MIAKESTELQASFDYPNSQCFKYFFFFRILSLWTGSGAGPVGDAAIRSEYTRNSNFSWPLKALSLGSNLGAGPLTLNYGLFSSCLKWNPPTIIKSLYTSLDIQLNWLDTTDSASTTGVPHRSI